MFLIGISSQRYYLYQMKTVFFAFVLVYLFANKAAAQADNFTKDSATIKAISDNTLPSYEAYENLRLLCKRIGARLSGSPAAEKAVKATFDMMQKAGADTVYLQPCMVTHWVRGTGEQAFLMVDGKKQPLAFTSLGNSQGTNNKWVQAQIVEVKTMAQLHTLGTSVKGKIVFFNIAMNQTYVGTGRAYGEAGIGRRAGAAQAAKYGAVAAMVRSLSSSNDDNPHTGTMSYNDSFPKIPAIAISTNQSNSISKQLNEGKNISIQFKSNCKMLPKAKSYNVIGEIRGTTYPNEILTVGGHLDSWDLAEGAQDDGAGCVQSIDILRAIKQAGVAPERTIRAVMFMNEENGSGGAMAYLENAEKQKEQLIFALETDGGGFTPRGFGLDMPLEKKEKIRSWAKLFLPYGVYDFSGSGSGADIDDLKKLGTAVAGLSVDSQRYFDLHHSKLDTFEQVNRRELNLGTVNMAALLWLISKYGL
jgi:carboxypeptidase Q